MTKYVPMDKAKPGDMVLTNRGSMLCVGKTISVEDLKKSMKDTPILNMLEYLDKDRADQWRDWDLSCIYEERNV